MWKIIGKTFKTQIYLICKNYPPQDLVKMAFREQKYLLSSRSLKTKKLNHTNN